MKNLKIEKFLKKYDKMLPIYNEMIEVIKKASTTTLKNEKQKFHSVDYRIKSKGSLRKKIQDKGGKYQRLSDITDIIGVRIVTVMEDQVDLVAEKVKNFFIVDEKNTIDKRKALDPRSFGYMSLHYVVSFPEEEKYKRFKGIRFEIQIRSLLQHTWATIEHDLGYKSRVGIPDELVRSFSRVASLLELADKEFVNIKKDLMKYEEKVHETIKSKRKMPGNTPLNMVTIRYFIENNEILDNLYKEILTDLNLTEYSQSRAPQEIIRLLNYFKIRKIGELEKILLERKDEILHVTDQIRKDTGETSLDKVGIFYSMAYVLLGAEPLSEKLKFLELFKILSDYERKKMAEMMEEYYIEYRTKNKKQLKKNTTKFSLKNIVSKYRKK